MDILFVLEWRGYLIGRVTTFSIFLNLVVIDWILIQQKDSHYLLTRTDIIDPFDCRASYFCSWFCQAPLLGHHLSLCCSVGLVLLRKQNLVPNLARLEENTYVEIGAI